MENPLSPLEEANPLPVQPGKNLNTDDATGSKLNSNKKSRTRIIAHIFSGICILIMFFISASKISDAGRNISRISSVGGKTLEEAYYTEVGEAYNGYALALRAFGIFALILISNQGRNQN